MRFYILLFITVTVVLIIASARLELPSTSSAQQRIDSHVEALRGGNGGCAENSIAKQINWPNAQ